MAQPAALFVREPSVMMTSVFRPVLVSSQMRWLATRDLRSFLLQASGLMTSLCSKLVFVSSVKGLEERRGWWGAFWVWKGSARSVLLSNVATMRVRGEMISFEQGRLNGMCFGGITRWLSRAVEGR